MKNVLIIDDSELSRKVLKDYLLKNNHNLVGEASNGHEGFVLYRKLKPDIIFMDLVMPIQNGLDTIAEIRAIDNQVKIIVVSAYTTEDVKDRARLMGANYYVSKPIDEEELFRII